MSRAWKQIDKLSARIFDNIHQPSLRRTGEEYLTHKPLGTDLISYFYSSLNEVRGKSPGSTTIPISEGYETEMKRATDAFKSLPTFGQEVWRVNRVETRKSKGRGVPKKGAKAKKTKK